MTVERFSYARWLRIRQGRDLIEDPKSEKRLANSLKWFKNDQAKLARAHERNRKRAGTIAAQLASYYASPQGQKPVTLVPLPWKTPPEPSP